VLEKGPGCLERANQSSMGPAEGRKSLYGTELFLPVETSPRQKGKKAEWNISAGKGPTQETIGVNFLTASIRKRKEVRGKERWYARLE